MNSDYTFSSRIYTNIPSANIPDTVEKPFLPNIPSLLDLQIDFLPELLENASLSTPLTIDVQPDFRIIVALLTEDAIMSFKQDQHHARSHLTIASRIAYSLFLIHGYLLQCDIRHRSPRLPHVRHFIQDNRRNLLITSINNAYVPNIVKLIISSLKPHTDINKTVNFIPTLSTWNQSHDFGRVFTPRMFMTMHNLSLNVPTLVNDYCSHIRPWLHTVDYKIISTSIEINQSIFLCPQALQNRFIYCIDYHNNTNTRNLPAVFEQIDTKPFAIHYPQIDPYLLFLNADPTNIESSIDFVIQCSRFYHANHNLKTTLNDIFTPPGEPHILSFISTSVTHHPPILCETSHLRDNSKLYHTPALPSVFRSDLVPPYDILNSRSNLVKLIKVFPRDYSNTTCDIPKITELQTKQDASYLELIRNHGTHIKYPGQHPYPDDPIYLMPILHPMENGLNIIHANVINSHQEYEIDTLIYEPNISETNHMLNLPHAVPHQRICQINTDYTASIMQSLLINCDNPCFAIHHDSIWSSYRLLQVHPVTATVTVYYVLDFTSLYNPNPRSIQFSKLVDKYNDKFPPDDINYLFSPRQQTLN